MSPFARRTLLLVKSQETTVHLQVSKHFLLASDLGRRPKRVLLSANCLDPSNTPTTQANGGAPLLQPEFHRSYSAVGGVDVYFWNDDYESGIPSLASPPVGAFTGEQVDSRMPFSPVASPAVASRGMESIGSPSLANNEYSSPWWN